MFKGRHFKILVLLVLLEINVIIYVFICFLVVPSHQVQMSRCSHVMDNRIETSERFVFIDHVINIQLFLYEILSNVMLFL